MSKRPRLTEAKILEVLADIDAGRGGMAQIAARHDVSVSSVYKIRDGKLRPDVLSIISPARAPLVASVEDSCSGLELEQKDRAVVELARHYAQTIHDTISCTTLIQHMNPDELDDDTRDLVMKLKKKVEAAAVLADLGPKLLAALESLGASPKATAAISGKKAPEPKKALSALEMMRARHKSGA